MLATAVMEVAVDNVVIRLAALHVGEKARISV